MGIADFQLPIADLKSELGNWQLATFTGKA
jgi:hypothetical protein